MFAKDAVIQERVKKCGLKCQVVCFFVWLYEHTAASQPERHRDSDSHSLEKPGPQQRLKDK